MENKKTLIGGILGIGLIAVLIWFLFFRKKSDGKTIINVLPSKEPNTPTQPQKTPTQPQKQVVYINSGASATTFPLRQGSIGNEVKLLQEALNKAGFNVGTADGAWGNNTQKGFTAAFPNKLGVNDLKELETMLADLAKRADSSSSSTGNTSNPTNSNSIKTWSGFAGKQANVKLYYTAVGDKNGNFLATYDKGDKIILTGDWKYNKDGKVEVEFYRHNDRGKAWILYERIEIL